VGELGRLRLDGTDNFRMRMSVDIRPDRAVAIEVSLAAGVEQSAAASLNYNQGLVSGIAPITHLGEWMPDVGLVCRNEVLKRRDQNTKAMSVALCMKNVLPANIQEKNARGPRRRSSRPVLHG
jgi:hypothetical protein